MKRTTSLALCALLFAALGAAVHAAPLSVDLPMNTTQTLTTAAGAGLPPAFGNVNHWYAVLRLAPLAAGRRYELTLTYEAGGDVGYGLSWVDGDPAGKDYLSFTGIGSSTGRQVLKGKQEKYLFSVDPKSSSNRMYLVVRSDTPWNLSVGITDRPSGVDHNSKDPWGFFYVTDLDADRGSPFLLTRGGTSGAAAPATPAASPHLTLAPGETKRADTARVPWMPSAFGAADYAFVVFRLAPLAAGRRYEMTLTYEAGTDVSYALSWVDGDPAGKDWRSFTGIGSSTGRQALKDKQEKYLFSVDAKSTSSALYVVLRSDTPWNLSLALTDKLTGVTPGSKDRWGYFYVSDFDAERTSPFLLVR